MLCLIHLAAMLVYFNLLSVGQIWRGELSCWVPYACQKLDAGGLLGATRYGHAGPIALIPGGTESDFVCVARQRHTM